MKQSILIKYRDLTDVRDIMKKSRDEEELRHIWAEWHNKGGNPIRELYEQFVPLANKAAQLNSKLNNKYNTRKRKLIKSYFACRSCG